MACRASTLSFSTLSSDIAAQYPAALSRVLGRAGAGGLADQVVALGDVRGQAAGRGVRLGGGGQVAVQLVQVSPDGVPAVPLTDHVAQPVGLAQSGGGTE